MSFQIPSRFDIRTLSFADQVTRALSHASEYIKEIIEVYLFQRLQIKRRK